MKILQCIKSEMTFDLVNLSRAVYFEELPPIGAAESVAEVKMPSFEDLKSLQKNYQDESLTKEQRLAAYKQITDFYEKASTSKDKNMLATWRKYKKWENEKFWAKERTTFRSALASSEAQKLDGGIMVGKEYALGDDANIFDRNGKPRGILFAGKNTIIPTSDVVVTIDGDDYIKVKIKDKANPYSAVKYGLMQKDALGDLKVAEVKMAEVKPVEVRKPIDMGQKEEMPVTGLPGEKERAKIDAEKQKEKIKPVELFKSLEDQYKQYRQDAFMALEQANLRNEACANLVAEVVVLMKAKKLTPEVVAKLDEARQQLLQFDKFYGRADSSYNKLIDVTISMANNGYDQARVKALHNQAGDVLEMMARSQADMVEATSALNTLEAEAKNLKVQEHDHAKLDNLKNDVQKYIAANHGKSHLEAHADGVRGQIVIGRYPFEESAERLIVRYTPDKGGQYFLYESARPDMPIFGSTEDFELKEAPTQEEKFKKVMKFAVDYFNLQND